MSTEKKVVLKTSPFPQDVTLTEAEDHALTLLYRGEAEAEHQQIAFDTICQKLCRISEDPHVEGDPHQTAHNTGIQKVGRLLIQIVKQPFKEE